MKHTDITETNDIDKSLELIRGEKDYQNFDLIRAQYEVSEKRDILNRNVYRDKDRKDKAGNTTGRIEVNRAPLAFQKRIVDSTVSFTFGNPIELECETTDDVDLKILSAIKRMLSDNKIDSFNRQVGRDLARCTECAEVWYPVPQKEKHKHYGFETDFKIRTQLFSPWIGDSLYPYYDQTGDMIAFGREYEIKELGKKVNIFEIYTDEEKVIYKKLNGEKWELVSTEPIPIGKIPIVYAKQDSVEWSDVQYLIARHEKLLSKFGDTNDYFGHPSYSTTGSIISMPDKDQGGKIFELENGAELKVVSWDQAPESIKLEMDTLSRYAFSNTQTPDLSFDAVKGLDLSGKAMRFLFMDAHLKVKTKREIFDPYLQRRINILKAFLGQLNTSWETQTAALEIKPNIVPYIITNEEDIVNLLSAATGGQALVSQETAVGLTNLVKDPDTEFKRIKAEQAEKAEQEKAAITF